MNVKYSKTLFEGSHIFEVSNEKKNSRYLVTVEEDSNRVLDCFCPHHKHRKQFCKHMKAVSAHVQEFPEFFKQSTEWLDFAPVNAHDINVIERIVKAVGQKVKNDPAVKRYVSMCCDIWEHRQTQIYIEDVAYRFDDPFSSGVFLRHRLGLG